MSELRQRPGDQPLPTPNDEPDIQSMVIADIQARRELGRRRYGVALQPFNGRDALRDLYEELLDGAMYAKQAMVEREHLVEHEDDEDDRDSDPLDPCQVVDVDGVGPVRLQGRIDTADEKSVRAFGEVVRAAQRRALDDLKTELRPAVQAEEREAIVALIRGYFAPVDDPLHEAVETLCGRIQRGEHDRTSTPEAARLNLPLRTGRREPRQTIYAQRDGQDVMVAAGMTPETAAWLVDAANRGHLLAKGIVELRATCEEFQDAAIAERECSDIGSAHERLRTMQANTYGKIIADLDRIMSDAAGGGTA